MPYAELNSLYHHVLGNVDNIEAVKQVLGVLIVGDLFPMGFTDKTDDLLFWQPGETEACLSQLASVIECDAVGSISILHASLSDFLFDPSRSRQFYLCRGTILGECAALGLCHLRQQELDYHGVSFYGSWKNLIPKMFYSRLAGLLPDHEVLL